MFPKCSLNIGYRHTQSDAHQTTHPSFRLQLECQNNSGETITISVVLFLLNARGLGDLHISRVLRFRKGDFSAFRDSFGRIYNGAKVY